MKFDQYGQPDMMGQYRLDVQGMADGAVEQPEKKEQTQKVSGRKGSRNSDMADMVSR